MPSPAKKRLHHKTTVVESMGDTYCKSIEFSSDGFLLRGTLHLPEAEKPPVIIGSHGLLSSSRSPKQIELADGCAARGMAFFRFDHRGCGRSQGRLQDVTTLAGRSRDLADAARTILDRNDTGKGLGLFGSSMGGAVCLNMAEALGARAVVTVAAPVRSRAIAPGAVDDDPDAAPDLGGIPRHRLAFDLSDRLGGIHCILIFHGDADDVVPVENADEIYRCAGDPKALVIQAGGDHRMSRPAHQRSFLGKATDWFVNHLEG
jgi:alpha-beta hydrolase superfamily lysophospholipase